MSDVNLTVQEGSDVYLSLTETPAVVSVTNPLVAAASFSVTVGTSVTVSNFPAVTTVAGTVTANVPNLVFESGSPGFFGVPVMGLDVSDTYKTIGLDQDGRVYVNAAGTVTASLSSANLNSVTVGVRGSVTVANFPATQVVSVSNFPASSSVTIANFPAVTTVAGTVALDSASLAALESVTVTIGAAVSISNFPTTQVVSVSNFPVSSSVTIGGFSTSSLPPSTVTVANTVTINGTVTANVPVSSFLGSGGFISDGGGIVPNYGVQIGFSDAIGDFQLASQGNPFPISGTVTARGNLIGIGQEGTGFLLLALDDAGIQNPVLANGDGHLLVSVQSGTVTVGNSVTIGSCVTHGVRLQDGLGNNLTSTSIGGVQRLNVSLASAATPGGSLPSFVNVYGGSDGSAVRTIAVDSSGRTVVTVANFPATQAVSLASTTVTVSSLPALAAGINQIGSVTASISGTVPVSGTFWQTTQPVSLTSTTVTVISLPNVTIGNTVTVSQSGSVTIGTMPGGALTTRFGSVATANLAFITSAVTNTSRKYLLAQNISAGTVTIGIGFSPTTTQGIQLTAGGGLTFDAFCPTGAVYWLGAVTGAAFTILEG